MNYTISPDRLTKDQESLEIDLLIEPKKSIKLPVIPNAPLDSPDDQEIFGTLQLRSNIITGFVENAEFDSNIIKYDNKYQNNQSVSPSFQSHMHHVLTILKSKYPKGSTAIEVGCGKGDFVELIEKDGWFEIQGFDGAYEGNNPKIEKRFLTSNDRLHADLVILRHVLEHIHKPHKFLELLSDIFTSSDIYIEVPDFDWILNNQTFFDITYEHVNYFSMEALKNLFSVIKSHEFVFEGQYQYVIANFKDLNKKQFSESYNSGNWVPLIFEEIFPSLLKTLNKIEILSEQKPIFIWGGATKGVLLCHHISYLHPMLARKIKGVIDINPMKQGKFLPSTHLPILSVNTFCKGSSGEEFIVIMNPNYEKEILENLKKRGLNNIKYMSF